MKKTVLASLFSILLLASFSASTIPREWAESPHNNREMGSQTLQQVPVEIRGEGTRHCARCHSEQGFLAWLEQLKQGNPGHLVGPDGRLATVEHLRSLGLTQADVRPITCQTCHDADWNLRVVNNTPVLPSGFQASAVGAGALCMVCHSTREGKISWNAADHGRYTSPHYSAQGDVLLGKNAYFVDDTQEWLNPHAHFTGGSCVTCHMRLTREEYTSHTFKAPENLCTSCHGPKFQREMVAQGFEQLMKQVEARISQRVAAVSNRIRTVRAYNPETGQFTPNVAVEGRVRRVEILSAAGQIALRLVLEDGRELISQLGDIRDGEGQPVFPTGDPVVRAAWNYLLLKYGGARGVHNPTYTYTVLTATLEALK
ncbi:hypothetical protein [Thermus thermamylovorans]|uniref:Uncharacterized protein n=1 Tax=Thermus thermamylovorans TaxID=2509362 RepID=A0A4Q9B6T5_9DEIN|nr:hypothetical protein [Thermus thermamylovorans]TBH21427.1 hypothetical protein ETP66_02105 [Thermus thermamylovorans]